MSDIDDNQINSENLEALTEEQQDSFLDVINFVNDPTRHSFTLQGHAGTGKTYLVNALREALLKVVDAESDWIINKMAKKGYRLEGTVADIYGIFLRGSACGTIRMKDVRRPETAAVA